LEKNLFQLAQEAIQNFTNSNDSTSHNEQDKQAVREVIQAAYAEATPEERNELKQFEEQLEDKGQLH